MHKETIPCLLDCWLATVKVDTANDEFYHRRDIIWHYSRLSKIAMSVLLVPHSNSQEERVFSMVRNKTKLHFVLVSIRRIYYDALLMSNLPMACQLINFSLQKIFSRQQNQQHGSATKNTRRKYSKRSSP